MAKENEARLTLKTKSGCKKLFYLFLVIVLLSSFFAGLIASDFGDVNIENLTFDVRGGTLSAELYTPVGVSDKDSLPAVILMHGGGCTYGIDSGTAQELARRGFVVLNLSSYGAGLSQQPPYDEKGYGIDEFSSTSPQGVYDAMQYVRTLQYVDTTRIGIAGHSMGSTRVAEAAAMDVSYLTLNDILINVLYETFGQKFTEDEIYLDADTLAAERLNNDQLEYYNFIKEIKTEFFNNRVKAVLPFGGEGAVLITPRTETVAGYEVERYAQTNVCVIRGQYDGGYAFAQGELGKLAWQTGGEDIQSDMWYSVDILGEESQQLGDMYSVSIKDSAELADSIENRTARILCINKEDHSQNFFSPRTTKDIVKFFEQTLNYNNGSVMEGSAEAIDAGEIVWFWREFLNFIAMISMLVMMIPLGMMLMRTDSFEICITDTTQATTTSKDPLYWGAAAIMIIGNMVAMYYGCNNQAIAFSFLSPSKFMPLDPTASSILLYLVILTGFALVTLIICGLANKKKTGTYGLNSLRINIGVKGFFKTLVLAVVLLLCAYASLAVIKYLFKQDYRYFMAILTELKVEHWAQIIRYSVMILPLYAVLNCAINYSKLSNVPDWVDNIISVVTGSLGVFIIAGLNYVITNSASNVTNEPWSSMMVSYGLLILVPATVYLSKKFYKITGSIWLGTFFNSLLIGWAWVSSISSTWVYMGSSLFERILGF